MQNQDTDVELCALQRGYANANPFYLLATLFGEPESRDEVTKARNRRAWNRFYAGLLASSEREACIERGVPAEDLKPYSQEEENKLAAAFAARQGRDFPVALPIADAFIDFQNTRFDNDADFEGFIFSNVVFSRAKFSSSANFKRAVFLKESHFEGADFAGGAVFDTSCFAGPAHFQAANIAGMASWKKAVFKGTAHFDDAKFHGGSSFEEAHFTLWAAFRNAQFAYSHFGSTQFSGGTTFEAAIFSGAAHFSHAVFADWLSFQDANFHSSSLFHKVQMKGKTIFDDTRFLTESPEFSGAKLYPGTDWEKIKWPKPKGRNKSKKFLLAYERLKREADKLEHKATAMEALGKKMRDRPLLQGRMLGLPIFILSRVAKIARNPV